MQTISSENPPVRKGPVASMSRHPLIWFVLLNFGFTWTYETITLGVLRTPLPWFIPATYGPLLAAFIVTAAIQGRAGVRDLLRRCILWRVRIKWYLVVLFGLPILTFLCALILPEARAALQLPTTSALLNYILLFLLTSVIGGPLGEEVGWRGFALPHLQQNYGPLIGTLMLGMMWWIWHLPIFLFVPGYNGAGEGFGAIALTFVVYMAFCVAQAVIFTWVFNNTRGSVFIAILLHTMNNTGLAGLFLVAVPQSVSNGGLKNIFIVALVLVAVLLIVVTRGRLDYDRYLSRQQPKLT